LQKQNTTEHNRYNIDKKKKQKKEMKKENNEMKYGRATTDL